MEQRRTRPRRSFTPEFKAEIVGLCQRGNRSIDQVPRDVDLTEKMAGLCSSFDFVSGSV